VILLDANLLVYAHVATFVQHEQARAWLDDRLNGSLPIGFPWSTLIAFLRLVTNPRIFERPAPIARAWHQAEAWLSSPMAWIPQPTERIARCWAGCASAMARAATLFRCTFGGAGHRARLGAVLERFRFRRFPGLRWDIP
jgi:uncharacterized protein